MDESHALPRRRFLARCAAAGAGLGALGAGPPDKKTSRPKAKGAAKGQWAAANAPLALDRLTVQTFQPHVADVFGVVGNGGRLIPALLIAAEPIGLPMRPGSRSPFSLRFLVPFSANLPEGIRQVQYGRLGSFSPFLEPIGPGRPDGALYEAIFT